MMRWLRLLLIATLLLPAPNTLVRASFDDQDGGARASGMSDAFVAVADDADAIAYNPAGLVQLNEGQVTSQYSELVKGLGDGSTFGTTYLGYAMPITRGYNSVGLAYHNFKADNLFNERTLILSYGHRLDLEPYGWRGIFSVGGNIKQLHREFQPDRFTENALNDSGVASNQKDQLFSSGNSKDTFAGDLGALAQFGSKYQYTAGIAAININQPDVSLGGDGDKAPLGVKAGVGYRPKWGTATIEMRRTKRLASETDSDIAFGLERNIPLADVGAFILRGGYASGSRNYKAATLGLSYLFSRFRLDYAFSFPISAIPGVAGSHRLGFSFRLGASSPQLSKDYSNADLLEAFIYDSLATHVVLTRFAVARNIPTDYKDELMMLIMRKYKLDDPGLKEVRPNMRDLMRKYSDLMEWPRLKMSILRGVSEQDKADATTALEMLVRNDAKSALMRISVLPIETQRTDRIAGIALMALTELAAQTYRANQLDACIDAVRRMLEIMPQDEIVIRAYRQLLARRTKATEEITVPEQEAPPTLVAPNAVGEKTETPNAAQQAASAQDILAKAYGTSLGYYFTRKAAGAETNELSSLLQLMKTTYKGSGLDLSLIDRELADLQASASTPEPAAHPKPVETPQPAPTPAPTPKPVQSESEEQKAIAPVKPVAPAPIVHQEKKTAKPATPAPKRVAKPAPVPSSDHTIVIPKELERAWRYYQDAAARDISDNEKIEILSAILKQFGEEGAPRVNKELARIRRRMQ
jgi:hypothetical protein